MTVGESWGHGLLGVADVVRMHGGAAPSERVSSRLQHAIHLTRVSGGLPCGYELPRAYTREHDC